jgi:hypothetical protein
MDISRTKADFHRKDLMVHPYSLEFKMFSIFEPEMGKHGPNTKTG